MKNQVKSKKKPIVKRAARSAAPRDDIAELRQALSQRVSELAILNSVQVGLASQLDLQKIYDLVGDKIREIFNADTTYILSYDREKQTVYSHYYVERGQHQPPQPIPFGRGLYTQIIKSRQVMLFGTQQDWVKAGATVVNSPGQDRELNESCLAVPILLGSEVTGVVSVQSYKQNAYGENDVRLLTTLANAMSVALQNAQSFKAEQERIAELQIINSIQQGLAAELNFQAIINLVGDKLRAVFKTPDLAINWYDEKANLLHYLYNYEHGKRLTISPQAPRPGGIFETQIKTRQPVVWNNPTEYIGGTIPGTDQSKSLVSVPVISSDRVLGNISMENYERENAFGESELRLLTTIAASLGTALENARLFDETQRLLKITGERNAELAIINSVQAALAAKLEMQAIYDAVGNKIQEIFDAQVVDIVTYDPATELIQPRYVIERGKRFYEESRPLIGFRKHVVETRQPLLLNEDLITVSMQYGNPVVQGEMPKSVLYVPMLVGNDAKGIISLQNLDRENAFSESDVSLLSTLSNAMSVALENARLFAETQRLLKETEQRAAELSAIGKVSQALVAEPELDNMIQLIGNQMREIFNADIVYVALLDPQTNLIHFPYQIGETFTTLKLGEGLTSKIIQTGEPLLINQDVDERSKAIGVARVGKQSLSYLGVPIKAGNKTIGVISVQSTTQEGIFNNDSMRLLTTIAANAGAAIHTARLFREAEESRAVAEQANKAKSTFLANMSHELRTPLNAIIGFSRIVRRKAEGALPEKQIENIDKVLASSEHLLGLINTVLDIAKIEAGRMDVIAANFNLGALTEQCANLATPLLKPNVTLEKQVDENLGLVYSDQDKIKQIVINLLSNAAKFTHEGKIVLAANKRDDETLDISITDSGIGISEEALGRIFEEFQQADTSTTRQYGGTGLGLAISRNLARLLGGDLVARSELGIGSTFTLTLPTKYGSRPAQTIDQKSDSVQNIDSPSVTDVNKKRILVIDDDPDAVYLLQESLNPKEFLVNGARDGHAGLQLAREQQPDAILLDILMPEMDGWQVLNDLKEDSTTTHIPVILLTIVDKKTLGFRLGADAYLLKPLDPTLVLDALRKVIGNKDHSHKHVLVVDDDPNVAEMLSQTLTAPDFELASAEDGEAGLQAIQAQRPDVILLDLMMPKLDGFGVIERLRADPGTRDIPIIVISAKELSEDETRNLKESVAFVMKKQGFNSDVLAQEIHNVLKTSRSEENV